MVACVAVTAVCTLPRTAILRGVKDGPLLTVSVVERYPNSVCLASKLIFNSENWFISWLHNHTAIAMQRRLHLREIQMIITPIKI